MSIFEYRDDFNPDCVERMTIARRYRRVNPFLSYEPAVRQYFLFNTTQLYIQVICPGETHAHRPKSKTFMETFGANCQVDNITKILYLRYRRYEDGWRYFPATLWNINSARPWHAN